MGTRPVTGRMEPSRSAAGFCLPFRENWQSWRHNSLLRSVRQALFAELARVAQLSKLGGPGLERVAWRRVWSACASWPGSRCRRHRHRRRRRTRFNPYSATARPLLAPTAIPRCQPIAPPTVGSLSPLSALPAHRRRPALRARRHRSHPLRAACDGFYFPISGATPRSELSREADRCSAMCSAEARLFYHSSAAAAPRRCRPDRHGLHLLPNASQVSHNAGAGLPLPAAAMVGRRAAAASRLRGGASGGGVPGLDRGRGRERQRRRRITRDPQFRRSPR